MNRPATPLRQGWLAALAGFWLLGPGSGTQAPAQVLWERSPYRIQVLVAIAPHPELTGRLASRLESGLAARADAVVGAAWDLKAGPAPAEVRSLILSSLATLETADLPQPLVQSSSDKLILLALGARHGGYELQARDCDLRTRLLGSTVSWTVRQRAHLVDEAFRAVMTAFAPLAEIHEVADKTVTLRLRASALRPLDPAVAWVRPGDVFRPVLRFNDREGNPRNIVPLEWTLLSARAAGDANVTCQLHSGLKSPLSGRRRGRVEPLALAVRPPHASTRLELRARTNPQRPLAGYEVHSQRPDSESTVLLGRTDGSGALVVAPDPAGLRVLWIKNGGLVLAKLPLLPGLDPAATALIPDDDERLAAEGIIHGLQHGFADLVVRRAVLMIQARARIEAGKLDEAQKLLDQLRSLGTQQQLAQIIRMARRKIYSQDPMIQHRIQKLFADTEQVVLRFLDDRQIEQLAEELRAARRGQSALAPAGGS